MTNARFAPITVTNPLSENQIVRMRRSQTLCLRLDKNLYKEPVPTVKVYGDLLLRESNHTDRYWCYEVICGRQKDLERWEQYSSIKMGDVWITSGSLKASIDVMLQCVNPSKEDFVSVILPDQDSVRLRAGDVLEVILFQTEDEQLHWEWQWDLRGGVDVELIGEVVCSEIDIDDPDYPYATLPRWEIGSYIKAQKHFWFRFDSSLTEKMRARHTIKSNSARSCGSDRAVYLGTFMFDGWNGENLEVSASVDVHMDLEYKHMHRVCSTSLLPKMGEPILPPETAVPVPKVHPVVYPTSAYSMKFVRGVSVKVLDSKTLESGCVMASASVPVTPDEIMLAKQHCGYDSFGCNYYQWPPQQRVWK